MCSYDGAETCELVGNFLLSQLQHLDINMGLCRDDRLAITNTTPRQTENIKMEICQIFNRNGLRITIEANKQVVNFLDVDRKFLQLLDKHFHKDHVLHKIFNRNTVKVSYNCTPNMGSIIRTHNRKVLRPTDDNHPLKSCNCRKPESCQLDGNCLDSSLVY